MCDELSNIAGSQVYPVSHAEYIDDFPKHNPKHNSRLLRKGRNGELAEARE